MRYNISLKLIECLGNFVTHTKTVENNSVFLDLKTFDFPIYPLSLPNEFGHAMITVSNDKEPIKIKLNISPTLHANEKLAINIKKVSTFLSEKRIGTDYGDLFEYLSLIDKLKTANFEFDENGQVSYLTADSDIQGIINDFPRQDVRDAIFAKATKLNTLLNNLIK